MSKWIRRVWCVAALLSLAGSVAACGPGAAAKAVRPDMPTGGSALGGGKCVDEPWVVDLSSADYDRLTTALGAGVAVVKHDCAGLKVLQNCSARGGYQYEGKPSLAETKQLKDEDEIRAELSGGPLLAAKMSSDIQRGVTLDIAYTHVGTSGTTARVGKGDLKEKRPGGCEGATHIVEAVLLGAYQMKGSTAAEVQASLEAFKQGVEGKSSSSVVSTKTGGKAPECASAKEGDRSPVNGCRFPLQLRLAALEPGSVQDGAAGAPPPRIQGMTSKTCRVGDLASCSSACMQRGDGASCAILGFMYEKGKGVGSDSARAASAYKAGCDRGNPDACAGLGLAYSKGDGVPKDDARAEQLLREGCQRLNARACSGLGNRARKAGRMGEAVSYLTRACNLGYGRACFYASSLLLESDREPENAYRASQRGCDGADVRGCLLAASLLSIGHGTAADVNEGGRLKAKALSGLEAQCMNRDNEACEVLGDWYTGLYKNPAKQLTKAAEYYQKACDGHEERACEEAKRARSGGSSSASLASNSRGPGSSSQKGGRSSAQPSPRPLGPSMSPSSRPLGSSMAPSPRPLAPSTPPAGGSLKRSAVFPRRRLSYALR